MRFKPVHLPVDRRLDGKVSQTFLRHYNGCPRSAYLYALYKGEASTVDMVRGSAMHEILERATRLAVEQGESYIPPDVVKVIVDEVLGEQHVPFEQHDYLRECSYRWASETAFDPQSVVAVETLLVLQLDGWEVRMKVDYADLTERGATCRVVDYKSSRSMPGQEDVARKRKDPLPGGGEVAALMAKNFQLILYALGLAYGVPVRVEPCPNCADGTQEHEVCCGSHLVTGECCNWPRLETCPCDTCGGSGRMETPEPFPLAGRAQRFDLEFVFPGIEDRKTGLMARRGMSLTRTELHEYLESLKGLLKRLAHSQDTGDWPAQTSDEACSECPARKLCPIPEELREYGNVDTPEEAAMAAEVFDQVAAQQSARRKQIKAFAKANGGELRYGKDRVWELVPTVTEKIVDRDGMFEAQDRAVQFGEPFDRAKFIREARGTDFRSRTLTADELVAEAAMEER